VRGDEDRQSRGEQPDGDGASDGDRGPERHRPSHATDAPGRSMRVRHHV
jgi:hypothetical protein